LFDTLRVPNGLLIVSVKLFEGKKLIGQMSESNLGLMEGGSGNLSWQVLSTVSLSSLYQLPWTPGSLVLDIWVVSVVWTFLIQAYFWSEFSSGEGIWIQDWVVTECFPSHQQFPSVDHLAACAAHVAH